MASGDGIAITREDAAKVLYPPLLELFREKFCPCLRPRPLPRDEKDRQRVVSKFLADTTALGYGTNSSDIHGKICRRLGLQSEHVRVEVVHRRKKSLWKMHMCNAVPSEVFRPRPHERVLVLATARDGHSRKCKAKFAVIGIVKWRALAAEEADAAWLFLKEDIIQKPGFKRTKRPKIEQGNGSCICNKSGCGTIIGGCYGHAIYHICSNLFRANEQVGKIQLENPADPNQAALAIQLQSLMNDLADKVGSVYKAVAPKAFKLQTLRLASAPSCQVGNKEDEGGNAYAAASVVYGCVHCHRDSGDAEASCAAVLSLCPTNCKDGADPLSVSVLQEFSPSGAEGEPVGLYLPHGTYFISPAKYVAHGTTPIQAADPLSRLSCVFFLNQDIGPPEHAKEAYDAIKAKEATEGGGTNAMSPGRAGAVSESRRKPESQSVTYVCSHCSQGFSAKRDLQRHIKNVHKRVANERGDYVCSVCSAQFQYVSNLSRHMKNLHGPEGKKFKCPKCPRTYKYKHNMQVHVESGHSGKAKGGRHVCSQCPKAYAYKCTLQMHLRDSHGVMYACEKCGKTFMHIKSLRLHKKIGCQVDAGKGGVLSSTLKPSFCDSAEDRQHGSGTPSESGDGSGSVPDGTIPIEASKAGSSEHTVGTSNCQVQHHPLPVPTESGANPLGIGVAASKQPLAIPVTGDLNEGSEPVPISGVVVEVETATDTGGVHALVMPPEGNVQAHADILPAIQRIMRGPGAHTVVQGLANLPPRNGGEELLAVPDQLGVLQVVEQLVGRPDVVSLLQDILRLLLYFAQEPASREILNTVIKTLTEALHRSG